jgi:orotate phosphoribosyltransferase
MVSIYTYGFAEATEAFARETVPLHALTNYDILLDQALRSGYITDKDLASLNEWRKDPAGWGGVQA